MLQQTRVETVVPYYERFLARFPDVRALATADLDEVLGSWSGLGYYSRARNLKRAAEQLVERFGGCLPDDPEQLRSLPGIGRYTAGAVASIAFDRPAPVVDGNVARVLSRILGIRDPLEASDERLWSEAAALVRGAHPGDLNQALMELGAQVCVPHSPRCNVCPVARHCDARARGDAEHLPIRVPKADARRVYAVAGLVERGGRLLAVRRPENGLLGGLWELPGAEVGARAAGAPALVRALKERVGLEVETVETAGSLEHVFTHRRLQLRVFRCRAKPGRVRRSDYTGHRWVTARAFAALPLGALGLRSLELALRADRRDGSRRASKAGAPASPPA